MLLPRKFSFPLGVTAVGSSRRSCAELAKRRREKSLRIEGVQTQVALHSLCLRD